MKVFARGVRTYGMDYPDYRFHDTLRVATPFGTRLENHQLQTVAAAAVTICSVITRWPMPSLRRRPEAAVIVSEYAAVRAGNVRASQDRSAGNRAWQGKTPGQDEISAIRA